MGDKILKKYPDLFEEVESKKIDARFSIFRRMLVIDNLNAQDLEIKKEMKKYILQRRKKIIFGHYNKKIKIATILLLFGEKTFKFFWNLYSKFKYEI